MAEKFPMFNMVTKTPDLIHVWWNNLGEYSQTQVTTHLGHLPSIKNLKAWPGFIEVITRFWDSERMVFRFGDVEMTPTIEEIQDCLNSRGMCDKRKNHPDHNILIPDKPTSKRMKDMLFLVEANWLDTPNILFMKFFERWGHENYFRRFPNEFHDYTTWISTRALAFSICFLGTMVFPRDKNNEIDSRVVMATHAIFYGIGEPGQEKYFNLVPVILADVYRSLSRCKNGHQFFQGCNLLLQWWMTQHLATKVEKGKQSLQKQDGRDSLAHHEFRLNIRKFRNRKTKESWSQVLSDLKEENVLWMFDDFVSENVVIQGRRLPFLILVGIRGIRPYSPNRVMRQFGKRQIIPKQGNTSQYVIDYDGCEKVPYDNDIFREWSGRGYLGKESLAKDRYDAGYDESYREWLKMDLLRTLTPGPHLNRQLEDVESKIQVQNVLFQQQWDEREQEFQRREQEYLRREQEFQQREYESQRALAFVTQELTSSRTCLV